jgi:hypothetical protein
MANNYCSSSSFMEIPKEKMQKAMDLCVKITTEIANSEDGCCNVCWESQEDGIWFYDDEEYINIDHLAEIADKLIEELKIEEPFFASWSYTCSKPRIDEFGGGAFVKQLGQPVYFVDAMEHVRDHTIIK